MPHARPGVVVPPELVAHRAGDGIAGRRWVEPLPHVVASWCQRWSLSLDDAAPGHGTNALVVPVHRGSRACLLKIAWRASGPAAEVLALQAWAGGGAVELLAHDDSGDVLLLERLDAGRSLHGLPLSAAAGVAGELIARLAVPAPDGLPAIVEVAQSIAGVWWTATAS